MRGRVYLVGAGPGDPELLTIKALRVLRSAEVVLHDELVTAAILELIPATARVLSVGRRAGAISNSQHGINEMMVGYARAGVVVVRLKGGDPLVFSRASEEITALRAADIPFEIVPGITAALGAAAAVWIPLTARSVAPGVALVTYRPAAQSMPVPWRNLLACGLTLAVYMPGNTYEEIAAELRNADLDAHTPCAAISRASTPQQKVRLVDLERLGDLPPLPAPALLIIGEVADKYNLATVDAPELSHLIPGFDGTCRSTACWDSSAKP